MLSVLLAVSVALSPQVSAARSDTVWVYNSWESIMEQWPDTVSINPEIAVWTPYDIEFDTYRKSFNQMLKKQTVATCIGDTIWLINTQWLRDNGFKGDSKKMDDYTPLFFNAKMAFIQCVPSHTSLGMVLLGGITDPWVTPPDYYWIDFEQRRVDKVDHKKLSQLLEFYPDLQRRYEQMRHYKEQSVIEHFFLDFVRRAERDPNYPYLLDRLNQ